MGQRVSSVSIWHVIHEQGDGEAVRVSLSVSFVSMCACAVVTGDPTWNAVCRARSPRRTPRHHPLPQLYTRSPSLLLQLSFVNQGEKRAEKSGDGLDPLSLPT